MRFVVSLFLLVAVPCSAAKVDFAAVLKKFPPVSLPFVINTLGEPGAKLSRDELDALGVFKTNAALLEPLQAYRQKLKKGQTRAMYPVAAIVRGAQRVLALRFDELSKDHERRQTFLLSYDEQGALLGGLPFHVVEKGALLSETDVSNLNFIGVASRVRHVTRPLKDAGLPTELLVHCEQRAKVTSTGALEVMAPSYLTRSGAYVDPATKEELRVFDTKVFHRAGEQAPFVELEGDGKVVRFKGAEKPYLLTWDDRRSAISAQTPAGTVQVFTRVW